MLRSQAINSPACTRGSKACVVSKRNIAQKRVTVVRAVDLATAVDITSLSALPSEILLGGGAAVVSAMGIVAYAVAASSSTSSGAVEKVQDAPAAPAAPPPLPRENAVLVFGATGRVGKLVVQQLVSAGRTVVAAVRSKDKANTVFSELGLKEGYQTEGRKGGLLLVEAGVDVTNADTLPASLWQGVTQVVFSLGGVFGRMPDGSFGVIDNMTSERVEAEGIARLMASLPARVPAPARTSARMLAMSSEEDLAVWERLDDVIMGGNSSSAMKPSGAGTAVWSGELVVEGGGFCGCRTKELGLDLSAYDGIKLRVKGDGQIFKLNIKTNDQTNSPEATYQATFDTRADGQWEDVFLPWHNFVCVRQAQFDPLGAPLDSAKIAKLGLVLSRFEFNKAPNPSYKPGPFTLEVDGGIQAYKDVRPQVVMVSSAGVERNALIGDDVERRKADIPIVQLNPGGTLNHKYMAEESVRASGRPYTVIRSTGMTDNAEGGPFLLEARQGDIISGAIGRDEVAAAVVAALASPEAACKTFELRRIEAMDAKGKNMVGQAWLRLFSGVALDRHRWRVGLDPMPRAVPPPPPVTEQRKAEILADPRVVANQQQERLKAQKEADKPKVEKKEKAKATA